MTQAGPTTYSRSNDGIWTDLYRLLTAVFASERLFALRDEGGGRYDSVENLRQSCELREVHETLLRLAAGFRTLQDQEGPVRGDDTPNVNPFHDDCGHLSMDSTGSASSRLTLREACNKILHAASVQHVYASHDSPISYALGPQIVLFGQRNSKSWKCQLDVLKFVDCLFYNYSGAGA